MNRRRGAGRRSGRKRMRVAAESLKRVDNRADTALVTQAGFSLSAQGFSVGSVLGDTWTIYKRLFGRSCAVALAVVFPLRLLEQLTSRNPVTGLLVVVLALVATALVQGAL